MAYTFHCGKHFIVAASDDDSCAKYLWLTLLLHRAHSKFLNVKSLQLRMLGAYVHRKGPPGHEGTLGLPLGPAHGTHKDLIDGGVPLLKVASEEGAPA